MNYLNQFVLINSTSPNSTNEMYSNLPVLATNGINCNPKTTSDLLNHANNVIVNRHYARYNQLEEVATGKKLHTKGIYKTSLDVSMLKTVLSSNNWNG